jgi:formylglycine-generating enzyme
MRLSIIFRIAALVLLALFAAFAADAQAVTINWNLVGNPGNAADTTVMTDGTSGYGSVGYAYKIGTNDVTNSQYTEFLNLKDPNGLNEVGLYTREMGDFGVGGITFRNGGLPGSKYSVIGGYGNRPVNYVNWYDAIRFANWLNNGQGNGDTETGAYNLVGIKPSPSSVTRNPGAKIFLPSENEWYKAAYYNPATNSYFQYPTSSNTTPIASLPTTLPNHANYNDILFNTNDVGAYTGTTSPYGAFDMGGNVAQWNETVISGLNPIMRGGVFFDFSGQMLSSNRPISTSPDEEGDFIGFRVASAVPEPSSLVLAALGFIALAVWRLRRR